MAHGGTDGNSVSHSLAAVLMGWLVRDKRLQIGFEPSKETGMRMKLEFNGLSGAGPRN